MNFESVMNSILHKAAGLGMALLEGLVVLVIGIFISRKVVKLLSKLKGFSKLDAGVQSFVKSIVKVILYAIVVLTAMALWGIPLSAVIAALTSGGVAFSLAAQGVLGNFAGGLLILISHPFKVGDYISVNGNEGIVKEILAIYTIVEKFDNTVITIPNGSLTNTNIINYTKNQIRRVDLEISASYDDDVETVEKALLKVAKEQEKILSEPAPIARLDKHGDSSLDYTFRVWCKTEDYWDVRFNCLEAIRKEFKEQGIEIPYNKLDVFMKPVNKN